METRILADLALFGALVMESNQAGFPENPKIGTFIIKDQCLFGYLKIGDLETWYPFASKTNSYIHTQGLASTTWVVNHMLGTNNVWYQVRDSQGQIVGVGKSDIDQDKFALNFTEAITGTVVVVAPDSLNVPTIKASSITIAEGAVEVNSGGVFVNGSRVLTNANIADDIAAAVAPKANQATTYTKTETDARIQAIVGAAPGALDTLEEISAQLANDQNAVAALTASVTSGDASTLNSANSYTNTSIASEVTARNTAINLTASSTLAAAETYSDTKISAALVTAASDATTKADNAIAYTDNILAVETSARISAVNALDSSISGLIVDLGDKAPLANPTFTGTVSGITKSMVGLGNVDNTADAAKPVSLATQTALDAKAPLVSPTFTGIVSGITKTMVGLANVDNTSDSSKTVASAATLQTARTINGVSFDGSADIIVNAVDATQRIASSEKGIANGIATLDSGGKVPSTQLPSFVDDVLEFVNLAGFPISGESGKIYVALDTNKTYRWSGTTYIYITSGAVDSVAGKTGVVILAKADVGIDSVDNTSDAAKVVLSATKLTTARTINSVSFDGSANITVADATKLPLAGGTLTGAVTFAAGQTFPATVVTTTDTQILTNKTVTNLVIDGKYTEEVFTITDGASVDLSPANGTIQTWTLAANRSPTATGFGAGESMTLMVNDGTGFTITWPTVTWVNNAKLAPTLNLTGFTVIALWKVGTTLYGALVGNGT